MILPTKWISRSIPGLDSSDVLMGFTYEIDSYSLYVTNFKQVWLETVDKAKFLDIASKFGYEVGLEPERTDILRLLEGGIYKKADIQFTIKDDSLIINFKDGDFNWIFSPIIQDQTITIEVLANLNFQQFSNHKYLLYQLNDLQHSIEVKDLFIKFLSANFKLSHGNQLITKFKKNNKYESSHMLEFDQQTWQQTVAKKYSTTYTKRQKSSRDKLQEAIRNSINDVESWNYSNIWHIDNVQPVSPESSPIRPKRESEPDDDDKPVKVEPVVTTPERKKQKFGSLKSLNKRTSLENSIEPQDKSDGIDSQVNKSPTKPKRFGALSSKKRKL